MSKKTKQVLIFVSLVIFAQLLSSPFHSIGNYIYTSIRDQLAKSELYIESKEAKYSFPSKISIPYTLAKYKNYKSFPINNLSLSLSLRDLFILNKKINLLFFISEPSGESKINLDLIQPIFNSNKVKIKPKIYDLEIKKILEELKIHASGKFSLNGKIDLPNPNDLLNSSAEVFIKLRQAHYLDGIQNISPFLALPEIDDIKFDSEITKLKEDVEIKNISLSSSIGIITGEASLIMDNQIKYPKMIKASLSLNFTERGAKFFNKYLRLISKVEVKETQKKWNLFISKSKNKLFPEIVAKPI